MSEQSRRKITEVWQLIDSCSLYCGGFCPTSEVCQSCQPFLADCSRLADNGNTKAKELLKRLEELKAALEREVKDG